MQAKVTFRQVHVLCIVIQRPSLSMKSLLAASAAVSSGTVHQEKGMCQRFPRHPDPKVHFGWIQALLKCARKPDRILKDDMSILQRVVMGHMSTKLATLQQVCT